MFESVPHFIAGIKPLYTASGFAVGVLVGLTGAGGGSLMTPLLVLVFGIHPTTAVGTDLLYSAATKAVGTGVHGAVRTIDWPIVGWLASGSIPASLSTILFLAPYEKQAAAANHFITFSLGLALIATAVAIAFRKAIVEYFRRRTGGDGPRGVRAFTIVLGAVIGVLVSLTSVGAGAIGVTALLVLYPSMPVARLVGSDIAHAVPLTVIAGMGQWMIGAVNLTLLGSLLVGSIPGIVIGSLLAARAPDRVLRPILASTLALIGVRLVF